MSLIARFARAGFAKVWWWLRQVTGDAAYENYFRRASGPSGVESEGPGEVGKANRVGLLSRQDFYLETLKCRYARVNRCC